MAAACPGVDSQDLATILDPFRAIFVDLGQTAYLRLDQQQRFVLSSSRHLSCLNRRHVICWKTDICFVSTHNVDVSEVSIVAMSQCSSRR